MRKSKRVRSVGLRFPITCLGALLLAAPLGCGADDKFSAETDDEYTEPLVDAIIGTPNGVTKISPTGVSQVQEASGAKGKGAVGSGGASSTGTAKGSTGSAGKASAGGAAGRGSTGGTGTAGRASTGGVGGKASTGGVGGKASTGGIGGKASTGGAGKAGFGGGPIGEGGATDPGTDGGFGFWHFDDCSPTSHFLVDSSGLGANAQQALKADCVAGISGKGVNFRSAKDIVQVADQPQFTLDQRVGVAAWVNPKTVTGDQPIVIKRLNNKTAFSLGIHNGNIEMSVVLSTGTTVISRAPIAANKWTHVAGMFDGTFVFLFINGQQFGQVFGAGSIRNVFAPIRIGATTQNQFFNGTIDEVFLTTQPITSDTLTALSCISKPSTLTTNPTTSGPVAPDTTVNYTVAVANNDIGACQPKQYDVFANGFEPGITASVDNSFQLIAPGKIGSFGLSVTGSEDADPGVHNIPFQVESFGGPPNFNFELLNGQVQYELTTPTGCFVRSRRELLITDLSVVDDPVRAAGTFDPLFGGGPKGPGAGGTAGAFEGTAGESDFDTGSGGTSSVPVPPSKGGGFSTGSGGVVGIAGAPSKGGTGGSGVGGGGPVIPQTAGVWSFGHLMREMAPSPEQAPAMVLKLLQNWLTNQTVNGFTVQARPAMQQQVIDMWPKTATGELDLDQSPLTLQAIVNRIDIRNLAEGSAGEGRFVFGVNGGANFQNFTVIVEYNLVAHTEADVDDWANRWHALGALPFPSEQYNAALEAITRRFTDRGSSPGSVNDSALVELRTNEIALSFRWEFRAFSLSSTTGFLAETTVKETPDLSFNNTSTFASFVNQNANAIIGEVPGGDSHTVPLVFNGAPFMGGSVFNDLTVWNGPGIENSDARFHASLNTCNGCHGPETNTGFLMVSPRFPGSEAQLSPFITGTTARDPFSGQTRNINDLGRRKTDLTALVCDTPAPVAKK